MELTDSERRVVDRIALNTLDEDDTRIDNDIIILPPHCLKNGKQVVTSANRKGMLMGREWEDDFTQSNDVVPAVHRSPLFRLDRKEYYWL